MRLAEMTAKETKDWLKAKGHKPAKVNPLKMKDLPEKQRSLRELHRNKKYG